MTMILTCLAKDFIVQASDRRLTAVDGKKVRVVEDHGNKALIYGNHFTFAYTGLAKLPVTSAIDWAAQHLSEKANLGDAVLHLGNCASDLMNSSRIMNICSRSPTHVKRLAFIGAGFADVEVDGRWNRRPFRMVISNFFQGKDDTWLAQPRNAFSVAFHWLAQDRDFELFTAGQQLPEQRQYQLKRILARCFQRKAKPETIGRLLTREIQTTAKFSQTVGRNIMCVMVPRPHSDSMSTLTYRFGAMELKRPVMRAEPQCLQPVEVIADQFRFVVPPPFDTPVFVYVSGDSRALPYYGPILVAPGYVMPPLCLHQVNLTVPPVGRASDA